MTYTTQNNFEGGTNGSAITLSGSGGASGDQFTASSAPTGSSLTYSAAAAAHGSLGMEVKTTASGVAVHVESTVVAANRYAARFAFKLSAQPNVQSEILRFRSSAATPTTVCPVTITANNFLNFQNAIGTSLDAIGSYALQAGITYRPEVAVDVAAGFAEWKLFAGDSTTLLDTRTVTADFGSTTIGKIRFGRVSGSSFIGSMYYDDLIMQDLAAGFPGPVSNPVATVRPNSLVTNSGGFTIVGGVASLYAALADELDTTYALSPASPSGSSFTVGLGELTSGIPTVTVRHDRDASSPSMVRLYEVLQGTTVVSSQTVALPDSITDFSWLLTSAEDALITDRKLLRLRFTDSV